jgi:hypothetical protein
MLTHRIGGQGPAKWRCPAKSHPTNDFRAAPFCFLELEESTEAVRFADWVRSPVFRDNLKSAPSGCKTLKRRVITMKRVGDSLVASWMFPVRLVGFSHRIGARFIASNVEYWVVSCDPN